MTFKLFKSTLKANLRSLVFWFAVFAILLFLADSALGMQNFGFSNYHKALANFALMPLNYAVPIFLGVVISVDILRDRKNAFFDIEKGTNLKSRQYFIGKTAAYLLFGFIMTIVAVYGHYIIYYFRTGGLENTAYTVPESIWLTFERTVFYGLNAIPVYTALAMCIALLSCSSIIGIVGTLAVAMSSFMIQYHGTYFGNYIYPVTDNITNYFYFHNTHVRPEAVVYTDPKVVFISYAYGFAIAAVLFTVGYIRLKKLNDK